MSRGGKEGKGEERWRGGERRGKKEKAWNSRREAEGKGEGRRQGKVRGRERKKLTLAHFHIGNGLPLVHSHKPLVFALTATRKVDDQLGLVVVEGGEDGVEVGLGELAVGEEVGGYDDL